MVSNDRAQHPPLRSSAGSHNDHLDHLPTALGRMQPRTSGEEAAAEGAFTAQSLSPPTDLGCVADVILHMMDQLLSGDIPQPLHISRVLRAVQAGADIYSPDAEEPGPPPPPMGPGCGETPSRRYTESFGSPPGSGRRRSSEAALLNLLSGHSSIAQDEEEPELFTWPSRGQVSSIAQDKKEPFSYDDPRSEPPPPPPEPPTLDEALVTIMHMPSPSPPPEPSPPRWGVTAPLPRRQSCWGAAASTSRVSSPGPSPLLRPPGPHLARSPPQDSFHRRASCNVPWEPAAPSLPRAWSTHHISRERDNGLEGYPFLRMCSSRSGGDAGSRSQTGASCPQVQLGAEGLDPAAPSLDLEEVHAGLAAADEWQWDVFAFEATTGGHALSVLGYYVLQRSGLIERFDLDAGRLARFLRRIEEGYKPNPYHNSTHAADVLHSMHVLLHKGGLVPEYVAPDSITLLACYLAAIVHDYEHLGVSNDFLIGVGDPLALMYNDKLPLENFHIAASFAVLSDPEFNFMQSLSEAEFTQLRKLVIDLVLATDMKSHVSLLAQFSSQFNIPQLAVPRAPVRCCEGPGGTQLLIPDLLSLESLDSAAGPVAPQAPASVTPSHMTLALQLAIKCSDLGHAASDWDLHMRWVERLQQEQFLQGDLERANQRPLSQMCDRRVSDAASFREGQVRFFDAAVVPMLWAFRCVFPGSARQLSDALEIRNRWAALQQE